VSYGLRAVRNGDKLGSTSLGSQRISITTPTGGVKSPTLQSFHVRNSEVPTQMSGRAHFSAPFSRFTGALSPTSLAMRRQAILFPFVADVDFIQGR